MIKNAIFDVDGTILNTFKGVSNCIKYALKTMDKPIPDDKTLRRFLGPSLMDSCRDICGFDEKESLRAIELYRELYMKQGIYECEMFDGYPQIFDRLKEKGVILSVASSKPKKYIRQIFDKLGITKYFTLIEGPEFDGKSSDKTPFITAARAEMSAVMIGDRHFDITAAKKIGIPSIGVTYGFCEDNEFEIYKPDFIAKDTNEIYDIIMSNN